MAKSKGGLEYDREMIIIQEPYQNEVTVEGKVVVLPFTNTYCEVRLVKVDDTNWCFVERQTMPSDPSMSWKGNPLWWNRELKELGWETMLKSRLAFHGRLALSSVVTHTGRGKSTVRQHFERLARDGRARIESSHDDVFLLPS